MTWFCSYPFSQRNRVNPASDEDEDNDHDAGQVEEEQKRMSGASSESAGKMTFGRTPPESDNEGEGKTFLSRAPCDDGHVVMGGVVVLSEQLPAVSRSEPTPLGTHHAQGSSALANGREAVGILANKDSPARNKHDVQIKHASDIHPVASSSEVPVEPDRLAVSERQAVSDDSLLPSQCVTQDDQDQGSQHSGQEPPSQTEAGVEGNHTGTAQFQTEMDKTGTVAVGGGEQSAAFSHVMSDGKGEDDCASHDLKLAEPGGAQDSKVLPTPSLCSLSPSLFSESQEVPADCPSETLGMPLPVPSPLAPSELLSSLTSMDSVGVGQSMSSSPTPSLLKHSKKVTFDHTSSRSSFSQLHNSSPVPDLPETRPPKRALPPGPLLPIDDMSLQRSTSNSLLHTSRTLPPLNLDDTSFGSKESLGSSNASLSEPRYTRRLQKLPSSRSLGSLESSESGDREVRAGLKGKKKWNKKLGPELEHKLSQPGLVGLAPLPEHRLPEDAETDMSKQ